MRGHQLETGHRIASRKALLLCVAVLGILLSAVDAWATRIVVFTPTSKNNTYWPQVFKVMNAVAEDLDIDLDIYEFDVGNRFAKHVIGTQLLHTAPKPDGAIFSVVFGNAEPLLQETEILNIAAFIQGPLFPSELPALGGGPRKRFKTWVGHFFQDEFQKGYLLGKTLLDKAHALGLQGEDGKVRVAGIGGDHSWFGTKLRQDGLLKAISEDTTAQLTQIVPTAWTEEEAFGKTLTLLERYDNISVVWAASDQLGIGAAKALAQARHTVGRTVVTGGLDLSSNGLHRIKDGLLSASVAASMLQYAKVLIYLYDYIHGIDFVDEVSTEISASLHVATRENVDGYLQLFDMLEEIDYSVHSKYLNPSLERYDLSVDSLGLDVAVDD